MHISKTAVLTPWCLVCSCLSKPESLLTGLTELLLIKVKTHFICFCIAPAFTVIFPMVLAGSACLHLVSFLSKEQCKKFFSYDHVDTAPRSKGFSLLRCPSTLNQIHSISATIHETKSLNVEWKRICLITQSSFQRPNCIISKQNWNENTNSTIWQLQHHLLPFLLTTPEIHCFAISYKPFWQIKKSNAWCPSYILLTYPNWLLTW